MPSVLNLLSEFGLFRADTQSALRSASVAAVTLNLAASVSLAALLARACSSAVLRPGLLARLRSIARAVLRPPALAACSIKCKDRGRSVCRQ